jgi:hypothetical protein
MGSTPAEGPKQQCFKRAELFFFVYIISKRQGKALAADVEIGS